MIAKSFIEIIVICVIATLAAFSNFSPLLRGAIDVVDQARIAGWAYDPLKPNEAIEVQLFIDGKFMAAGLANETREDLVRASATRSPDHGFSFKRERLNLISGRHTAQVYAVRDGSGDNKTLLPLSKAARVLDVEF